MWYIRSDLYCEGFLIDKNEKNLTWSFFKSNAWHKEMDIQDYIHVAWKFCSHSSFLFCCCHLSNIRAFVKHAFLFRTHFYYDVFQAWHTKNEKFIQKLLLIFTRTQTFSSLRREKHITSRGKQTCCERKQWSDEWKSRERTEQMNTQRTPAQRGVSQRS